MSKHTQGEWKVSQDGFVISSSGLVIADTRAVSELSIAETEANARLIAAAPKLLEALEVVVECPEHGWGLKEALELQQQCKAAIAAAKGEA